MKHAERRSAQISYRCSQTMLPQLLKATTQGNGFIAAPFDNVAHIRDRKMKWDDISVTARKVMSVRAIILPQGGMCKV